MRRTWFFALPLAGLLASAVLAGGAPLPAGMSAAAAATRSAPVFFGLGTQNAAQRNATEKGLGVKSAIVGSFATRSNSPHFWINWARDVRADGAVLQLFWDPTWGRKNDRHSTLRSILAGEHDAYIRHWTRMVASYRHPG